MTVLLILSAAGEFAKRGLQWKRAISLQLLRVTPRSLSSLGGTKACFSRVGGGALLRAYLISGQ